MSTNDEVFVCKYQLAENPLSIQLMFSNTLLAYWNVTTDKRVCCFVLYVCVSVTELYIHNICPLSITDQGFSMPFRQSS